MKVHTTRKIGQLIKFRIAKLTFNVKMSIFIAKRKATCYLVAFLKVVYKYNQLLSDSTFKYRVAPEFNKLNISFGLGSYVSI